MMAHKLPQQQVRKMGAKNLKKNLTKNIQMTPILAILIEKMVKINFFELFFGID